MRAFRVTVARRLADNLIQTGSRTPFKLLVVGEMEQQIEIVKEESEM